MHAQPGWSARPSEGAGGGGGGGVATTSPIGPADAPAEPRQRWRLVFARPSDLVRQHREIADAWLAELAASDLPLARPAGRPRPPLAFAAPLPVGTVAEREVADLTLAERLPVASVRDLLVPTLPPEIVLLDLFDVWLGAPALAAAVTAADHRVELADPVPDTATLTAACATLLAAPTLHRERTRGSGVARYDLRPLLDDVRVQGEPAPLLRIRTRFHPERGTGRPEEVVAALSDVLTVPLDVRSLVRERLILDEG